MEVNNVFVPADLFLHEIIPLLPIYFKPVVHCVCKWFRAHAFIGATAQQLVNAIYAETRSFDVRRCAFLQLMQLDKENKTNYSQEVAFYLARNLDARFSLQFRIVCLISLPVAARKSLVDHFARAQLPKSDPVRSHFSAWVSHEALGFSTDVTIHPVTCNGTIMFSKRSRYRYERVQYYWHCCKKRSQLH
jgi:hypothetical protein